MPLVEARRRQAAIHKALKAGHGPLGHVDRRRPGALQVAAAALGLTATGLRLSLPLMEREHGIRIDWSLWKPPATGAIGKAVDRGSQRQADELARLREALRAAHRELNAAEDLRAAVFGLAQQPIEPPAWTVRPGPAHSSGIPILFTSDFQWGENISARELDGINAFNTEIAIRRYRYLIQKTIDLTINHMVRPEYPGIIYARGGDMISGEIHQELRETNDLQSIPAVQSLVEQEVWGITQLLAHFPHVRVISVPGNHGRTTIKPFAKRYAETNYDTLSAWMLESWFQAKGEKRVSFWTPASGDALFPIYGWWFLLTHGDRIGSRGGQGFIGPAATIARGMKKLMDYYATLGQAPDVILCGHFHTRLELEYGFSNGSLPGASEYARDGRMSPRAPSQWLLFAHQDYGVTARWPIFLEKRPRIAAAAGEPFGRAA